MKHLILLMYGNSKENTVIKRKELWQSRGWDGGGGW
jgi:hypothetical protein